MQIRFDFPSWTPEFRSNDLHVKESGLRKFALILFSALAVMVAANPLLAASISIRSPRPGQTVSGPDVRVEFSAPGFCTSPGGNNLHFMLDDQPFEVQYDASHPHVFKNVLPGTHTVRVYAANSMHEAIPGSLAVVTFNVMYADGANAPTPGAPLLTYVLPQGEYLGVDAGDITVHFLANNVQLSPGGNRIAYYVDGRRYLVYDQAPRHVQGLAPGPHIVRVELQDQFGDLVPGPFNSTERTIIVSPHLRQDQSTIVDKYPPLPHLRSIKGAMTVGRPWVALDPPRVQTKVQAQESQRLTVRREVVPPVNLDVEPDAMLEGERVDLLDDPDTVVIQPTLIQDVDATSATILPPAEPATTPEPAGSDLVTSTPAQRRAAAMQRALDSSAKSEPRELTTSTEQLQQRRRRGRDRGDSTTTLRAEPTTGGVTVRRMDFEKKSTTSTTVLQKPVKQIVQMESYSPQILAAINKARRDGSSTISETLAALNLPMPKDESSLVEVSAGTKP